MLLNNHYVFNKQITAFYIRRIDQYLGKTLNNLLLSFISKEVLKDIIIVLVIVCYALGSYLLIQFMISFVLGR